MIITPLYYLLRAEQWRNCGSDKKLSYLQSVHIDCGTSTVSCSVSVVDSVCQNTAAGEWSRTTSFHLVAILRMSETMSPLPCISVRDSFMFTIIFVDNESQYPFFTKHFLKENFLKYSEVYFSCLSQHVSGIILPIFRRTAPHDHSQHNQRRTPYAVIHSLVLLKMGIMMLETCWDRQLKYT